MKRAISLMASLFFDLFFQANGSFSEDTKPKHTLNDILESQSFEALAEDKKENVLKEFLLGQPEPCICSTPSKVLKGAKINDKLKLISGFAVHCNCGEIDCAVFLEINQSGVSHNPVCFTKK